MANESDDELSKLFSKAASHIRMLSGRLHTDKLLYFYARFKQVKEGPCNIPKPGFFDFQGKQKWEAWKQLGNKTEKEAMLEYVSHLSSVDPDWMDKTSQAEPASLLSGWVAVSTMCRPDKDTEVSDHDKTVFDWCKDGNVKQLEHTLRLQDVNQTDSEGMALLHWACDRGHDEIVLLLLKHSADINIRDSDGQTPLHYAASCDHVAVVQLLRSRGADLSLVDSDGLTPSEMTENPAVVELLSRPS